MRLLELALPYKVLILSLSKDEDAAPFIEP
jgi:hypothetical protein